MDDRASSVAREVKEPGQGEAAGLGRCHGFHVQRSGSLAWTWADGPAAIRSIHGVPAPRGQGKIEFGLGLVGGADVDRTDRDERLRDQRQPAGRSPAQCAGRGRAAQFGLG